MPTQIRTSIRTILTAAACCALFNTNALMANEGDDYYIGLGGGLFGILDSSNTLAGTLTLEGPKLTSLWDIRPAAQAIAISDTGFYIGIGGVKEFELPNDWSWGLGFSGGYAHEDDESRALEYDIQFYSRIMVNYDATENNRLRLELGHISNADLGSPNPGSEPVLASWMYRF